MLGVLPIIYNTVRTLATLSKVRRVLRHDRFAGTARGDVINHVIEVDLPRLGLSPLQRYEEHEEYWNLCEYRSHLPGASWTVFNWKSHTIGRKTQRIDYPDQLRAPQAEIVFEDLLNYLLDLGAVPDEVGFSSLRGSGLWTPLGTTLMRSPDRLERVLTVAPLDDSDGYLSLAVNWSPSWTMRGPQSLPPYWVLLRGETSKADGTERSLLLDEKKDSTASSVKSSGEISKAGDVETSSLDGNRDPAAVTVQSSALLKYTPPENLTDIPALRCQVGSNGLLSALPNDIEPQMFESFDVQHLRAHESSLTAGMWFASAITALSTTSKTILWNYKIPPEILAFSRKDTIPCGVLVLLDVVEESATPDWATKYENDAEEEREAKFRQMSDDSRAMMRENQLPPNQRAAAFHERARKRHDDWVAGLSAARRREAQRAETRTVEALTSPKWGNKLSAEHFLAWLKKEGHVEESHDLGRAVEILLWKMVKDPQFSSGLAKMLDEWRSFVDNGGLRRGDYSSLKEGAVMFGYAVLLVAIIDSSATAAHGSVGLDVQECVRIWKRVRLG